MMTGVVCVDHPISREPMTRLKRGLTLHPPASVSALLLDI